ncbi:MAG: glycosyltransferase family 39 protein [Chloroflexi bacterium]|nr:glycosyltransferase family 39 protein [Chloroflexota bacterium]
MTSGAWDGKPFPLKPWIVALLLFVTWMGARRLNAEGFWYDEWWALYNAGASDFGPPLSPIDIWKRVAAEDPWQIPGYFWVLSAWGNTVGWTEYAGRALSLLAGVLAVVVVYRLGWAISSQRWVAFGAAVAFGGSAWFIYYLHEMRVYTLYALLAALLLLLYRHIMNRKNPPGFPLYAALVLTAAALLYCHYFAVILVAAVGLWHVARLLRRRPDRRWWTMLACLVLAGLMLLPWLSNAFTAIRMAQRAQRVTFEGAEVLTVAGNMVYAFSSTSVALFALLAIFSLGHRAARGVWLLTITVLAGSLAAYQLFHIGDIRYAIGLLPLLALIAGLGFQALAARRVPLPVLAGIWIAGALLADDDFRLNGLFNLPPQPIREMAAVLAPHVGEGDVIINHLGSDMIRVLHIYSMQRYLGSTPARLEMVDMRSLPSVQAYARRVREAVGDAQRLWVIYAPRWPSSEWSLFVYLLNEQNLFPCATLADDDEMRVLAFGRVENPASAARFGDMIEAQLIGAPRKLGGVFQVWLGFEINRNIPPDTYSVTLDMVDDRGAPRGQHNYDLPAPGRGCYLAEIPIEDLPPGRYRLEMAVYDERTDDQLAVIGFDGKPEKRVPLALVTR